MRAGIAAPTSTIARALRWVLVALLTTTPAPPGVCTPPPPAVEQRIALVIGNGDYRHVAPLVNPPNDARLTAATLQSLGFQLIGDKALLDVDRAAMEHAIRDFGRRLRGSAVGLFYYAGHGVQIEGENYLVPVSADVEDAADVKYELVDTSYVLDEMKNAGTRLNIVILDACRNNPFGGRGLRALSRGLAQMQAPESTIISYATQPGNVADDGTGKNSPFTAALTAAMTRPGIGVFDTFNQVGLEVERATGGRQQPWLSHNAIDWPFQFRQGSAEPVPAPASASPPPPAAGAAQAAPAPAPAQPLIYPEAPPLHFGKSLLQPVVTAANRVGGKQYPRLPESSKVVVYSSESEATRPYEVVATLVHSNPCTLRHCTVESAIEPLSAKAREVGANGIIIDSSQTVKTSLTSTGVVVHARAIRLPENSLAR